ncbi:MAG: lysophospholipid acyltransferase family protein [Canibacter sp.]
MRTTVKIRGRSSDEKRRPSIFWVLAGAVLPLWSVMTRYRYTPESRLPASGPFIVAPNHFSEIDPISVGVAIWHLGRAPRFMAKASLFRIPVIGWIMRKSGQIPVERGSSRSKPRSRNPIGAASEIVKREAGVIVYPEGTLTRDPDLWPMRGKTGAVRLALEADIPLYPMAHWGSQELMPRYGKGIRPFPRKTIEVAVGKPFDLSRFRNKPLTQQMLNEATEELMNEISKLAAQLRGITPPVERWDPLKHDQSETGRF